MQFKVSSGHTIEQHKGGEQGDPIMPLLFTLRKCGNHWKKENGCSHSLMMCMPASFMICCQRHSGNAQASRCTPARRAHGISRERPADLADLGLNVWNPLGIKILGTPVGHYEFVANFLAEQLAEEQRLWDAIPFIPHLQCSWQVAPGHDANDMRTDMIWECNKRWKRCWGGSLEA